MSDNREDYYNPNQGKLRQFKLGKSSNLPSFGAFLCLNPWADLPLFGLLRELAK
jgi:hypothetical protein